MLSLYSMANQVSVEDALAMSREATRVLTAAASDTWNRMMRTLEEILRPANRNYILSAFKPNQSMTTVNNVPTLHMSVSALSGGVTGEQILKIKQAAGSLYDWKLYIPTGANTATLDLWITVVTPASFKLSSTQQQQHHDERCLVRRALEDHYTSTYFIGWSLRLLILVSVSYFFFDASPATRARIFG